MTHPGASDAQAQQTPPTQSTSSDRILTIAVVVMGIMIAVGLAVVVARVIYLATAVPKQAPGVLGQARVPPAQVRAMELGLPAGAVIRGMALSGDRIAVHYDAAAGAGIVLIDTVTGEVVARIRIGVDRDAGK